MIINYCFDFKLICGSSYNLFDLRSLELDDDSGCEFLFFFAAGEVPVFLAASSSFFFLSTPAINQ